MTREELKRGDWARVTDKRLSRFGEIGKVVSVFRVGYNRISGYPLYTAVVYFGSWLSEEIPARRLAKINAIDALGKIGNEA